MLVSHVTCRIQLVSQTYGLSIVCICVGLLMYLIRKSRGMYSCVYAS